MQSLRVSDGLASYEINRRVRILELINARVEHVGRCPSCAIAGMRTPQNLIVREQSARAARVNLVRGA